MGCDQSPRFLWPELFEWCQQSQWCQSCVVCTQAHWAGFTLLQDGAQSLGSEDLVLFSSSQVYLVWGQVGQAGYGLVPGG